MTRRPAGTLYAMLILLLARKTKLRFSSWARALSIRKSAPISLILLNRQKNSCRREGKFTPAGAVLSQRSRKIGIFARFPEYQKGLKDIEGFSHLILIYHFNRSKEEKLVGKPFLEDKEHGIFAIRSPHRPNHLGFSIVKVEKIKDSTVIFSEVDMLDKTPLLDIKPYVSHFDSRKNVKNGWIKKHFKNCKIPKRIKI